VRAAEASGLLTTWCEMQKLFVVPSDVVIFQFGVR
jgi:hypothetical protein